MRVSRQAKTRLFIFGTAAGAIVTVITSSIAAIKTLRKMGYEIDEKIDVKEYLKSGAPYYIPTGIAVGGTIVSCLMLNKTHRDYQKALTSAYIYLGAMYDSYRRKVRERDGIEAEQKISQEVLNESEGNYISNDYQYEFMYYEPYSNQFFRKTAQGLLEAEYELNRLFILKDYATMNDFLEILGLKKQEGGDDIGWSSFAGSATYGYSRIDFNHELRVFSDPDGDLEPIEFYEIQYPFEPTEDFLD